MLTKDEEENYKREERHACTCPDDQRWYAAALERIAVMSPTVKHVLKSQFCSFFLVKTNNFFDFYDLILNYTAIQFGKKQVILCPSSLSRPTCMKSFISSTHVFVLIFFSAIIFVSFSWNNVFCTDRRGVWIGMLTTLNK